MDRAKWELFLLQWKVSLSMQGRNEMSFEVPPNQSNSVSLWFFIATFPQFSTEILSQPSLPVSSGEQGGKNVSGGIGLQLVLPWGGS